VYGAYTLMRELTTWYDLWQEHGFAGLTATYGELDALKDSEVRVAAVDGTALAGKARGVNAQGELLVETERGVARIRAGEVERVRR
jgi:BirA family biotin operon repressor/biotin-[acetyl-CoA-carboxylase] ligase